MGSWQETAQTAFALYRTRLCSLEVIISTRGYARAFVRVAMVNR